MSGTSAVDWTAFAKKRLPMLTVQLEELFNC
jgi:hypothetical protein